MSAINQNFTMWAGDDRNIVATVKDDTGAVIDITNLSNAQWVMKKYAQHTSVVIEKFLVGNPPGLTITNGPAGQITISIDSADTSGVHPGEYYHELRIVDANSEISTVSIGTVFLNSSDAI